MKRICVLGAGVIGTSTAWVLLQQLQGKVSVTLVAETLSPDTTSDVAAGRILPHALGDTPPDTVRRWTVATMRHLLDIHGSAAARAAGVAIISGYEMSSSPDKTVVDEYSDVFLRASPVTAAELALFAGTGSRHGVMVTTLVAEGALYTPWLLQRFLELGGTVTRRKVEALEELYPHYDVVVNCTGLGAYELCGDKSVFPARGQVIKVDAPWIKHVLRDGEFYVIPGQECVTLGGTHQENNWSREVDAADAQYIMDGCTRLLPSLKECRVLRHVAGLRPCRPSVRLEEETVPHRGRNIQLVHNYGHGGAGVTLHYGCARDVLRLVERHLPSAAKL